MKYIIFWQTKESMPDILEDSIQLLAPFLKMIEIDTNIQLWGRCEGLNIGSKLIYNGFIIFEGNKNSFDRFCTKWQKYIDITSKHRFYSVDETQDFLLMWKKRTDQL